jgi:hypothetical protein
MIIVNKSNDFAYASLRFQNHVSECYFIELLEYLDTWTADQYHRFY